MANEVRKDLSGRLGGNSGIVIDIRISQKRVTYHVYVVGTPSSNDTHSVYFSF
jgi:hypothetical protein